MTEELEKHLYCPYPCRYRKKIDVGPVTYDPSLELKYQCEVNPKCAYIHELNLMTQLTEGIEILIKRLEPEKLIREIEILSSLPDNLRQTYKAIEKLGSAQAEDIAEITGRTRAVESGYANQLVRMSRLDERIGVKREKDGRKVLFFIEEE